jgi:hypothetical protein
MAAAVSGDEIWVAVGVYQESILVKDGVSLYGGFAGNETERDQRDWKKNETVLEGTGRNPVIRIQPGNPSRKTTARIDGFTIRNGYGAILFTFSAPTIANNVITGNISDSSYPVLPQYRLLYHHRLLIVDVVDGAGGSPVPSLVLADALADPSFHAATPA